MSRSPVTISRDPFARCDTVREKASDAGECAWCGQPARFRYGQHADDRNRPSMDKRAFCSVSCRRAYYL